MANSKFETELLIKAGVQGLETIAKLGKEIEAAGLDVAKLSSEGQQLNKTFREIEQKQQLITQFKDLKKATADTAGEWQQAQEKVRTLKQAMDAQGTASKAQIAAYKQATTEAKQLKQKHGELTQSLQQTRTAMKDAGVSTKNLTAQEQTLQTQSRQAQQSLTALNNEARKLSEIAKAKITLGIDSDEKARQQIIEVGKAYEALKNSGQLTSQELARANELHTQKVKELESQLGKTAPTLAELTGELSKIAGQAAGLAYVSKAAISFEEAMAGVKKTVDGTPEQIQQLSGDIKDLAVDLGMTSESVAAIAAQGGQLGIPIEKLGEFTEMAGKMAVAFDMTAEEAADAAAKLANVFGIPITEVESLGDAINTLGNNMAAKEKEIVAAMLRIGGSAKQFGLAEEQAASLAAAFIALGKPPEVAATAINALLMKLQTAEGQGQKFQDGLAAMGLSAKQLAADIHANPQQALSAFLTKLKDLDEQQRSMVTMQLFGAEYSDDISLLVESLETYQDALDLTHDKTATAGAMQEEFEAQMATTGNEIARAKQAVANLAISLGEHLLPIIANTASGVTTVVNAINNFATAFPNITKMTVLFASLMTGLSALNGVLKLTGSLGLKTGAEITQGFIRGKTAIDTATLSLDKFSVSQYKVMRQSRTLTDGMKGMAGQLASMQGLFAASAAWTIGSGVGDWLYENTEWAKRLGHELGRVLAYADALFTDRTFDDVRQNYGDYANAIEQVAEAHANATATAESQADAEARAAQATNEQADANRQLANDIKITAANVDLLSEQLADMERVGGKNSQAYQNLSAELNETQQHLNNLTAQAEAANIGDLLASDLDNASEAFKALGLDADAFATGIDSKTNQALSAFVDVARLAEGDTVKLARAYNAATAAAGDNVAAQVLLERNLMQVTEGNKELAESVKQAALAQQNAKLMSDEQAAALDKLGISMQAVNQSMSQSGLEMVNTLKTGIAAIKEQATSATALKTALQQAFDTSIAAAKTQADFTAIQQALQQTGVISQLTREQMLQLTAGMQGGAAAAKAATLQATAASNAQTQALDDNSRATGNNTVASRDNAAAKQTQAAAAEQAADAEKKSAAASAHNTQTYKRMVPSFIAAVEQKINALQKLGATSEQVQAIQERMYHSFGKGHTTFTRLAEQSANYGKQLAQQVEQFNHAKTAADDMSKALGRATVTSNDLSQAQHILNRATVTSIDGIVRMDSQTLDNLKSAIDSTRAKMQGLADDAKKTADNLEASLARLKGDNITAKQIEQTQKLTELTDKLNAAKQRGNQAEIAQLERALSLQRQINAEELRQAKAAASERQQSNSNSNSNRNTSNSTTINAKDVANAWDARIEQAKKQAVADFAKQLHDESKRRAR